MLAVFTAFLVFQFSPASASAYSIEGTWLIGGSSKITANFPGISQVSLAFPNVGLVNEVFYFNSDKSFADEYLGMQGTWSENTSGFTVNLKACIPQVKGCGSGNFDDELCWTFSSFFCMNAFGNP